MRVSLTKREKEVLTKALKMYVDLSDGIVRQVNIECALDLLTKIESVKVEKP